jgi:hypothetical protein
LVYDEELQEWLRKKSEELIGEEFCISQYKGNINIHCATSGVANNRYTFLNNQAISRLSADLSAVAFAKAEA